MRGLLVILSFSLLAFSCGDKKVPKPEGLLDKEVFLSTLKEIHLLDAAFRQKTIKEDYPNQKLPSYYEQVFNRHKVTKAEFDSTFVYYSRQPAIMTEINKEIENRIKVEASSIDADEKDVLN